MVLLIRMNQSPTMTNPRIGMGISWHWLRDYIHCYMIPWICCYGNLKYLSDLVSKFRKEWTETPILDGVPIDLEMLVKSENSEFTSLQQACLYYAKYSFDPQNKIEAVRAIEHVFRGGMQGAWYQGTDRTLRAFKGYYKADRQCWLFCFSVGVFLIAQRDYFQVLEWQKFPTGIIV